MTYCVFVIFLFHRSSIRMSDNLYRGTSLERALLRAMDKLDTKLTPEQKTLLLITMGQITSQYITTNGDALAQSKNNSEATMYIKQLVVNRLDPNHIRSMIGVETMTAMGPPDAMTTVPAATTSHVQLTLVHVK